jgi:eukaryotic-like serine/threonine-protein kinase
MELASPSSLHPATDRLAGTPYRAVAALGQGGMGEVFEAEHRALRKRVVVKLLRAELAHDPRFCDRLRVEAQTLAALSSPHLVAVSDLGETPDGQPYLVMERLHGRTLRQELDARGALPPREAIAIVRQVLAGLAAAHRAGIIHRDVKLDNVFLCAAEGEAPPLVKVLDFGVAKILEQPGASPTFEAPRYATEEGVLVGTPRSVAPEQVRCQRVDGRTDVYAAGLLLYTLVAGRGPFLYADLLAVLRAHLREDPAPPSQRAPRPIPPALDRAILRALAKRPEDRFPSAGAFAEALAPIERALADALPAATFARAAAMPLDVTETGTLILTLPTFVNEGLTLPTFVDEGLTLPTFVDAGLAAGSPTNTRAPGVLRGHPASAPPASAPPASAPPASAPPASAPPASAPITLPSPPTATDAPADLVDLVDLDGRAPRPRLLLLVAVALASALLFFSVGFLVFRWLEGP